MKKVKSNPRGSAVKGNRPPKNVDEYLAGIPEPARSTLNKVRAAIRSAVPLEGTETISYGIPAFKCKGVLVWYAAFSNHWGKAEQVGGFGSCLLGTRKESGEFIVSCQKVFRLDACFPHHRHKV